MELTNFKDCDVEVTDSFETQDFSIDEESLGILFKGFSDGLYSNKIGSIVREITSNCFDSHIEAGVTRPVTIEMTAPDPYTGTPGNISFIDYGVGLSPDRVKNIYSKYFASTKRNTNNEIGGFGIGCKSPLAYSETFMVITCHDGKEYDYIIHRGLKVPQIQLTETRPTDKHNGTEVRIPIKNDRDFKLFQKEIKEQLMYFDNIDYINCGVDNNYKIYQGKHFIVRTEGKILEEREQPSICIGKVKYPIDWHQINEASYNYNSPIALRFDIGEIPVTMNRESIEYTDRTKELIENKFNLAKIELQTIANNNRDVIDNFEKYMELAKSQHQFLKLDTDVYVKIVGFVNSNPPVYSEFVNMPANFKFPSSNPFLEYELTGMVTGSGVVKSAQKSRSRYNQTTLTKLFQQKAVIFRVNGVAGKRKNLYIHSLNGDYYLIRKTTTNTLSNKLKLLGLSSWETDAVKAQEVYDAYSKVILKYVCEHSQSYDRTEIDEAWLKTYLDDLKAENPVIKNKEEIFFRIPENAARYSYNDRQIEFKNKKMTYETFQKQLRYKQTIIYGTQEDSDNLINIHEILCCKSGYLADAELISNKVLIVKVSKEHVKFIKKLPGAIDTKEFLKKFHKFISQLSLYREFKQEFTEEEKAAILSYFPKAKKIYDSLARDLCADIINDGKLGNIDSIIETMGYHPAVAELKFNMDKLIAWKNSLPLIKLLSASEMRRDSEKVFKADIVSYAKSKIKSILNYE